MSDYDRLRQQLSRTPYLVANGATGDVRLVDQAAALRSMEEASLFDSQSIMHAARAVEAFAVLVGRNDRTFTLNEIARTAGVPYSQAHGWLTAGVIVPSVRPATGAGRGREPLFSWTDAFAAGICGSLRRQGLSLVVLRNVAGLFGIEQKKRTAKRIAAAGRS